MSTQNGRNGTAQGIRSVREVMDEVLTKERMAEGMTEAEARQEVAEMRHMSELYEDLLGAGYSDEQIGVLWGGKTPQEILAEAANGTATKSKKRRVAQAQVA